MKSSRHLVLILLTLLIFVFICRLIVPLEVPLAVPPSRKLIEAAPMCPWREPAADRRAFFPNSTSYRTETLILTSHFREFKARLGRLPTADENPLYVHHIFAGSREVGSILVRRVKGEYGAIEMVMSIKNGKVGGLRIQRMREPAPIARALNAEWLHSFTGKTMDSEWNIGPNVPTVAQFSAKEVVEGARILLILHEVGTKRDGTPQH